MQFVCHVTGRVLWTPENLSCADCPAAALGPSELQHAGSRVAMKAAVNLHGAA